MNTRILFINRNTNLLKLVSNRLGNENVEVKSATTWGQAVKLVQREEFDLIIGDTRGSKEEISGFLEAINGDGKLQTEIVMLGEDYEQLSSPRHDNVHIFERKPFLQEGVFKLLEKVKEKKKTLHAFNQNLLNNQSRYLRFGEFTVDTLTKTVMKGDSEIYLRTKEYLLLITLLKNAGRVLSREELKERAWGENCPSDIKTVEVTISSLRKKIEGKEDRGRFIRTERGEGYRLVP